MTDADRFHIPPTHHTGDGAVCQLCGPHFIGKCPHIPSMGVKASEMSVDDVKKLLGITSPAPSVDLTPIVAWWRDELSHERTAAADARIEARGHREEAVRLEARLAEMTAKADDWRKQCCELVSKNARQAGDLESSMATISGMATDMANLRGELGDARSEAEGLAAQLKHARCDAKDAQRRIDECQDDFNKLAESMVDGSALTPGSVDAIKAAVRLVCGHEPSVQPTRNDCQAYWCTPCEAEQPEQFKARLGLLALLETLQPAATVKP